MTIMPTVEIREAPVPGLYGELLATYAQCLSLSRDYTDAVFENDDDDGDLDEDSLRHFLDARAELLAAAEVNLDCLVPAGETGNEDPQRREAREKVISILEEMAEIEGRLAAFLGNHLSMMRQTISQLAKGQMIFTRYGQSGAVKPESRLTRHG